MFLHLDLLTTYGEEQRLATAIKFFQVLLRGFWNIRPEIRSNGALWAAQVPMAPPPLYREQFLILWLPRMSSGLSIKLLWSLVVQKISS